MMIGELEKFCKRHGLRCRITMGASKGSLDDAVRDAMSDYLERQGLVDLPMLRGPSPHRKGSNGLQSKPLVELEAQSG
jgi:hypothetical protein